MLRGRGDDFPKLTSLVKKINHVIIARQFNKAAVQ